MASTEALNVLRFWLRDLRLPMVNDDPSSI
jgi:hypothetical protein